ncbi:hypothetical protein [Coleofasciculus sp. D1-CHI-01]
MSLHAYLRFSTVRDYRDAPDIGSSILALLFVIRHWSLVIGHWSLVI